MAKDWPAWDELDIMELCRLQRAAADIACARHLVAVQIIPIRNVGVKGDAKSYDVTLFLYPNPAHGSTWDDVFPILSDAQKMEALGALSTDIVNTVKEIGRVLIGIPVEHRGS